jgi:hypothetical protein
LKAVDLSYNFITKIPKRSVSNIPVEIINLNIESNKISTGMFEDFLDLVLRSLNIAGNRMLLNDLAKSIGCTPNLLMLEFCNESLINRVNLTGKVVLDTSSRKIIFF